MSNTKWPVDSFTTDPFEYEDIPDEYNCDFHVPPDFRHHVINWNAPSEYYFLWPIAGIATIISCILTIPRIYQFHKTGTALQNKEENVFMPVPFRACTIISGFPMVISLAKLYVLFVPIGENAIEFICKGYEGISLYVFCLLIVMFLGGRRYWKQNIAKTTPSKYFVTLPFCCCCGCLPICKEKIMDIADFRIVYSLIMQFAVLSPIFSAVVLFRAFEKEKSPIVYVFKGLAIASVFLCLWALFTLLKATDSVLHSYNVHGKFWSIKLAVFILIFTPFIVAEFNIPSYDYFYTRHVMIEAYSSMIICVLLMPLAWMTVKYYTIQDAYDANENMLKGTILKHHGKEKIDDSEIIETEKEELAKQNEEDDDAKNGDDAEIEL